MVDTYKVTLRKKEGTYALDAAPTGINAALTRNWRSKPIQVDPLERKLDRPSRGRTRSANTNERSTFGYELEIAGSGAAGTAPQWMLELEACGMAPPVLTATTKAEQKFAVLSAALSSMTVYDWTGIEKAIKLGARGTFSLDFTAGAVPFFNFDFIGLIPEVNPVSNSTATTPDWTGWQEPLEVHTRNTDFELDGYAAVMKQFQLAANAEVKLRALVGANYIKRGNHAMTGRIQVEATTLASKNYYSTLRTGQEITTKITHGTVLGNIVDVEADHLQILDISRFEEDDTLMLDLQVGLNINTGADDLLIRAR